MQVQGTSGKGLCKNSAWAAMTQLFLNVKSILFKYMYNKIQTIYIHNALHMKGSKSQTCSNLFSISLALTVCEA